MRPVQACSLLPVAVVRGAATAVRRAAVHVDVGMAAVPFVEPAAAAAVLCIEPAAVVAAAVAGAASGLDPLESVDLRVKSQSGRGLTASGTSAEPNSQIARGIRRAGRSSNRSKNPVRGIERRFGKASRLSQLNSWPRARVVFSHTA
jgi:hypothetical protein